MSLVITEISSAGIAMVADSSISELRNDGRTILKNARNWRKLLKVPRIASAVSYWGYIGLITKRQFDDWLNQRIQEGRYADLSGFADYLVNELNMSCGQQPLVDAPTGIHVAGYAPWEDGIGRPFFFHIHNGHGHNQVEQISEEKGGHSVLKEVVVSWQGEPRKLFEKHQDFPIPGVPVEENLAMLDGGYETRNGDFFLYSVLGQGLNELFAYLNYVRDFRIPRDTSLGGRAAILKMKMDFMIDVYKYSTKGEIVGGESTLVGIRPDQTFL